MMHSVVVIHSISTSNHNGARCLDAPARVVIHSISTSNHNEEWAAIPEGVGCNSFYFYIKPQPPERQNHRTSSCNSFYFYIKPQLFLQLLDESFVVIHSISTSNHNLDSVPYTVFIVVLHSISTSNHNVTDLY